MRLYTPDSLLYPITVTKILRQPGDDIDQNAPLFTYEYKSVVTEYDDETREDVENVKSFYADFESELEGSITSLEVKKGQIIQARTRVAEIEEPCKHEIQYGGICANCGRDMTRVQYNSTAKNTERATVNTVHGHTQLLISQAEASKADEEAKRRLLDSRKLSLVVDLDQTIIHATVDPTVAEWQRDPQNPNYDAVKDVCAFQLVDDGPGARGCWYYIKLRPGLEDFLDTISQFYELHIYTMGTRAYAENIAKIIDPERKIFGDRILSRDESGSMTAKNLKRLFPVDTKMVVIIDDRGDVWHWSPNLVKVGAYDFFVGIGDINSSFLPKRPELEVKPPKPAKVEEPMVDEMTESSSSEVDNSTDASQASTPASTPPSTNGKVSAVDHLMSMAGKQDEGSMKEKSEEQDETIAAQLADRPLLQKQKILDAAEEEAKTSPAAEAAAELLSEEGESKDLASTEPHSRYRHNLLQDDDTELDYLGQSLRNIHQAYFDEYERDSAGSKGGRIAELRPGHSKKRSVDQLENIPDAAVLMSQIKSRVLHGVHLVFSGVVPLGVDIQSHDTAVWAKSFGATVSENIGRRTTHVIASPERRTAKVRQAAKKSGKIAIVNQGWLFACFTQWRKVDEEPFRIHSDAPVNGAAGLPDSFEGGKEEAMLSSSDEEAALTDDDAETGGGIETPNGVLGTSSTTTTTTAAALEIETDLEELEQYKPTERMDSSPTDEENVENWGDINDELADFLGSDVDDESDTESVKSERGRAEQQQQQQQQQQVLKTPPSQRKRKREAEEDEEVETAATLEGVGAGVEGEQQDGSRLQKRKKEALARTSSLTLMPSLPDISNGSTHDAADANIEGDPGGGGAKVEGGDVVEGEGAGEQGEEEEEEEDGDDDLEAALAAEMERQSEEDETAAAAATAAS